MLYLRYYIISSVIQLKFFAVVSSELCTTSQRLGAAAAFTTVHASYKRSILHCLFCGVTAAVAPNRQLAAVLFRFHCAKTFLAIRFIIIF